jgi:hypothetical protein
MEADSRRIYREMRSTVSQSFADPANGPTRWMNGLHGHQGFASPRGDPSIPFGLDMNPQGVLLEAIRALALSVNTLSGGCIIIVFMIFGHGSPAQMTMSSRFNCC